MAFKIYTRTGDQGETSLFGGRRLPKSHLRIDSYGTVDELNSYIGLIRDQLSEEPLRKELKTIQDILFSLGAKLASDPDKNMSTPDVVDEDIKMLETSIDQMDEQLPALKNFILPGGHTTVSYTHIARCVCRRAERLTVALNIDDEVDPIVIRYLNRLSDYLFTLARHLAQQLNAEEVTWDGGARNKKA
ncbi:MAG: cob(I)yrinic acid a,c-diamide adenosyltransferase [Bacteroidota bacterium]